MPNPDHESAQELSAQAEIARLRGDRQTARELYARAAALELKALDELPADKRRTRGILAVSYAALLFKAALYEQAEMAICALWTTDLDQPFREQLRELLQATWEEQLLARREKQYIGAELLVALRGGRIGAGTAPADTAVHYLNGMNLFAFRVAELEAGLELRRQGPPPQEIQASFESRATQPVGGSYRFSIRFVEPIQGHLFPGALRVKPLDTQRVLALSKRIFGAIAQNDAGALEEAVPRDDYRLALVRLARNVMPAGDALNEVEIRVGSDSPTEAVYLRPEQRRNASEAIKKLSPPPKGSGAEQETIVGTLRALDLDKTWLEIRPEGGKPQRVRTGPTELDYVIGPMVNRKVAVRVQHAPRGRGPKLRVVDIELVED